MRAVVLIALAAVLAPAWATNTNTQMSMAQIAARAVEAKYGRADQLWRDWAAPLTPSVIAGTPTGTAVATTRLKGPSPIVGEVIDVDVKRKLPWASISKAVAKSLPLISTAVAIAEIAEAIRCREAAGGAAECDPGQAEVSTPSWTITSEGPGGAWSCTMTGTNLSALGLAVAQCQDSKPQFTNCPVYNGSCSQRTTLGIASVSGNTVTVNVKTENKFCAVAYNCSVQSTSYPTVPMTGAPTSSMACPPVTVNGVTLQPVKGPDGKCMTNVYEPASEQAVADKVEAHGDKTKAPQVVADLLNAGKPIDHPFPEIDPLPGAVYGPRETTTHPDGSTTTRDTRYDLSPTPNGYGWAPTIVTKDWPSGVTPTPPGEVDGGTSTSGGTAPERDIITCGLPDTPACKIDESGTPSSADISEAEVDAAKGSALGKITEIGTIQAPAWTWSFALPTSCSSITVGPFLSQTVEVDLCAYQSMIHDLVSLIWAAFTVWACVGMVGRTFAAG